MRKNLSANIFNSLILGIFPLNLLGYAANIFRNRGVCPLLLLILASSFITGCIQVDKYVQAYPAQDKALNEPSTHIENAQEYTIADDSNLRLELDFQSEVGENSFHAVGTVVLRSDASLPYIVLNASLWNGDRRIEKVKYMLINVEPGTINSFDISKNLQVPQGDYDCIVEASGPFKNTFSEKRHCISIEEPTDSKSDSFNQAADYRSSEQGYLAEKEHVASYADSSSEKSKINDKNDRSKLSGDSVQELPQGLVHNATNVPQESKSSITQSSPTSELAGYVLINDTSKAQDSKSQDNSIFVGSTESDKYQRPDCRFVAEIKSKIYFKSAEEAQKNGKVPCKICNPA
jgi:hypothetical protein